MYFLVSLISIQCTQMQIFKGRVPRSNQKNNRIVENGSKVILAVLIFVWVSSHYCDISFVIFCIFIILYSTKWCSIYAKTKQNRRILDYSAASGTSRNTSSYWENRPYWNALRITRSVAFASTSSCYSTKHIRQGEVSEWG